MLRQNPAEVARRNAVKAFRQNGATKAGAEAAVRT